ncbi:hypothetical protein BD311DRAFT_774501 [Dichomitus squalens]|uniref:Thioredoxin-like protein n=1 Tax=Dichomitus squalens TaxID=114155 RepID=A0A4Q9MZ35_9APHY|nr:hypothetical protein BD311DRAFT_774501 [Dichomitus squalens]
MAATKQLTLYTATVRIALDEAGAQYKIHEFGKEKGNKPHWYYTINPLGKIPAITYGGPDVPSDQPSPESEKLTESLALLEFLADIYPESDLLPADPVLRAKARRVIAYYENYVHQAFRAAFFLAHPCESVLQAVDKFQAVLHPTGFAIGQFSIADCAVGPWLARLMLFLRKNLGAYSQEEGDKLRAALAGEKYARFNRYVQDVTERPSFQNSWEEVSAITPYTAVAVVDISCR